MRPNSPDLEDSSANAFAVEPSSSTAAPAVIKKKKKVRFEDEVTYVNYNSPPKKAVEFMPVVEIIQKYVESCGSLQINKNPYVVEQLKKIERNDDYSAVLNLSNISIDHNVISTIETIFNYLTFKTLYFDTTLCTRDCSLIMFHLIRYYDSVKELILTELEDNISFWKSFCNAISVCTTLVSITFRDIFVSQDTRNTIMDALSANKFINCVRFDGCCFNSYNVFDTVNTTIREFRVTHTKITSQVAKLIANQFKHAVGLEFLNLSISKICDETLTILIAPLSDSDSKVIAIRHLILTQNSLTADSVETVRKMLKELIYLELLNLSYNALGDKFIENLRPDLATKSNLVALGLAGIGMTADGLSSLAAICCLNPSLLQINVQDNQFTLNEILRFYNMTPESTVQLYFDDDNHDPELSEKLKGIIDENINSWQNAYKKPWIVEPNITYKSNYKTRRVPVPKPIVKSRGRFEVSRVQERNPDTNLEKAVVSQFLSRTTIESEALQRAESNNSETIDYNLHYVYKNESENSQNTPKSLVAIIGVTNNWTVTPSIGHPNGVSITKKESSNSEPLYEFSENTPNNNGQDDTEHTSENLLTKSSSNSQAYLNEDNKVSIETNDGSCLIENENDDSQNEILNLSLRDQLPDDGK